MKFGISTAAIVIEGLGSALVTAYVVRALWILIRERAIAPARLAVAQGVIAGLSFTVAAMLLKTIALQSWRQIGIFTAVLALRTILKRLFVWETQRVRESSYLRLGSHFTSGTPAR